MPDGVRINPRIEAYGGAIRKQAVPAPHAE